MLISVEKEVFGIICNDVLPDVPQSRLMNGADIPLHSVSLAFDRTDPTPCSRIGMEELESSTEVAQVRTGWALDMCTDCCVLDSLHWRLPGNATQHCLSEDSQQSYRTSVPHVVLEVPV